MLLFAQEVFRRSPCGERGLKYPALPPFSCALPSLPVRGAWIEIEKYHIQPVKIGRSPCGERGLKCPSARPAAPQTRSLPVRGAWIEIACCCIIGCCAARRSPCGERGLKCFWLDDNTRGMFGRSPCGERGLKCFSRRVSRGQSASLPVRGAWIEITTAFLHPLQSMSLPVRGAWIEIRF